VKTSGRENSDAIAATSMMTSPHHSAQLFSIHARPNTASPAAIEPERGASSPMEIIQGTTIAKLAIMPTMRLTAVRIPIRPPAPTIARSTPGESASWRMSTPASRGSGARPFSTSA
jgi:hypothetical protein